MSEKRINNLLRKVNVKTAWRPTSQIFPPCVFFLDSDCSMSVLHYASGSGHGSDITTMSRGEKHGVKVYQCSHTKLLNKVIKAYNTHTKDQTNPNP